MHLFLSSGRSHRFIYSLHISDSDSQSVYSFSLAGVTNLYFPYLWQGSPIYIFLISCRGSLIYILLNSIRCHLFIYFLSLAGSPIPPDITDPICLFIISGKGCPTFSPLSLAGIPNPSIPYLRKDHQSSIPYLALAGAQSIYS
jgi:hypothetical protein